MKKMLALLMAVAMVLSLAACSSPAGSDSSEKGTDSSEKNSNTSETTGGDTSAPADEENNSSADGNYVFEAEYAALSGNAGARSNLTDDGTNTQLYEASGVGDVEGLSSNTDVGASITWTITADADCTADLTFVLATRSVSSWTDDGITLEDLVLADGVSITVNGEELDLSGKVVKAPENNTSDGKKVNDGSDLNGQWWVDVSFGHTWNDVDLGTVNLTAGENTIVITSTVQDELPYSKTAPQVDCIKLTNATAALSFEEIDNLAEED